MKRKQWTKELLRQKRENDRKRIAEYRALVDKVLNLRDNRVYSLDALKETTQVLKINPEYNAAWNYRRDIIANLSNELDTDFWEKELAFSMSLLKDYPKVYWIWNHRSWTLSNHKDSSVKIWLRELAIVSKVLQMDPRNYHGWHYRRILIANIERMTGESRDKEELDYATANTNKNISNYSAWHQKAVLIPKMFEKNEIEDEREFVLKEFMYIINAIYTDAEDQSVWFYTEWFVKNKLFMDALGRDDFIKQLQELQQNILAINEDDLQFSGKQNNWCLKILIVLEDVLESLHLQFTPHSQEYLKQLIKADPLRKNRYLHLLNKE